MIDLLVSWFETYLTELCELQYTIELKFDYSRKQSYKATSFPPSRRTNISRTLVWVVMWTLRRDWESRLRGPLGTLWWRAVELSRRTTSSMTSCSPVGIRWWVNFRFLFRIWLYIYSVIWILDYRQWSIDSLSKFQK